MKKLYYPLLLWPLLFLHIQDMSAQVPVPGFYSCVRVIPVYETVEFTDVSTNSPYGWTWDVYDSLTYSSTGFYPSLASFDVNDDPFGSGKDRYSQNPQFMFDWPGCYTVVLKAQNASGTATEIKRCYITVIPAEDHYLGFGGYGPKQDNLVYIDYGRIFDDGGPNLNYGNGQGIPSKSFLRIRPANQQNLTLSFQQIRLAAGDTIRIFDADTFRMSDMIDEITAADNGTFPVYISSDPAMSFYFKSDATGIDSGYQAVFFTGSGTPANPVMSFVNGPVVENVATQFVSLYRTVYRRNYTLRWTVDDTVQTAYADRDTMQYVFTDRVPHQVCVEAFNCDTSFQSCRTVNAVAALLLPESLQVTVWPNPSAGSLQVLLNYVQSEPEFEVTDLQGSPVQMHVQRQNTNTWRLKAADGVSDGIYLLIIRSGNSLIRQTIILHDR